MKEPKIVEKDGKFSVIMPNGFVAGPYSSKEKCASFLGITTNMLKIVREATGRKL
jgi:hypothetical protein